jgi:hypothetical protein
MPFLRSLPLIAVLALVACDNGATPHRGELNSFRESLAHLHDLEDRTFALVKLDGGDGRMPLVGTLKALQDLEQEAGQAVMPGCVGEARDALTFAMEEIGRGGEEAWPKVEHYVNMAIACESLLAEQEKHWAEAPG